MATLDTRSQMTEKRDQRSGARAKIELTRANGDGAQKATRGGPCAPLGQVSGHSSREANIIIQLLSPGTTSQHRSRPPIQNCLGKTRNSSSSLDSLRHRFC